MDTLLDYTTLRLIWGVLLAVLFWAFALMDGFDLGVGILLPFAAKNDTERRILINSVGPVWEGNQVWLILGAGAIFAAWPHVYAVLFAGLYLPLFGVLCALILRPVGFKFRSKISHPTWRQFWDGCIFIAGIVPAFSFGLVLAHLILGLPFQFDAELRLTFTTNPNNLFHPFAVCSGLLWIFLFSQQGNLYLLHKTEGQLHNLIKKNMAPFFWAINFLFLSLFALWRTMVPCYEVLQSTNSPSNPLTKTLTLLPQDPLPTLVDCLPLQGKGLLLFCLVALLSLVTHFLAIHKRPGWGFVTHSALLGLVIAFMGLSHFPLLVLSSTQPAHSLTLWDASSSLQTLKMMLIAALIFVPLIIIYTIWVYRVMRGRIQEKWIHDKSGELY